MKLEERTVFVVDYNELDRAISEEFKIKYECVAYEEWGNYQSHEFSVKAEPMNKYDLRDLQKNDLHWKTSTLLNEMCHRGKIKPGHYLIKVFW